MKRIIYLNEKSFSKAPLKFFLVTNIRDINQDDLNNKILKGVTGISENAEIIVNFLGIDRDIVLLMDGEELVNKNKLTRIMYDNPNYLVSGGLKTIYRLFQRKYNPEDVGEVIFRIFDYTKTVLKEFGYFELLSYIEYHGAQSLFGFSAKKNIPSKVYVSLTKIKNLTNFVSWFIDDFVANLPNKKIKELFNIGFQNVYKIFYESLIRIGNVYKDEGEWILKDNQLKLPDETVVFLSIPNYEYYQAYIAGELPEKEAYFLRYEIEGIWSDIIKFKNKVKYIIKNINSERFKELQTAILNKRKNIKEILNLFSK